MTRPLTTPNSVFWRGIRDGAPFILVAAPFGCLFGVAATELGLNLIQTMTMTVMVIAGAAQFTALLLIEDNAPTLVIIITALAVNLRMAMYSAALAPYLGQASPPMRLLLAYLNIDQSFALSVTTFPKEPKWTITHRCAYFCGAALALMPVWVGASFAGAALGSTIPAAFSLDFAMPICFLALIGPLLRSLPHIAAAIVSVTATLALSWVPYSLGLILAACLAMATGAALELWLKERGS